MTISVEGHAADIETVEDRRDGFLEPQALSGRVRLGNDCHDQEVAVRNRADGGEVVAAALRRRDIPGSIPVPRINQDGEAVRLDRSAFRDFVHRSVGHLDHECPEEAPVGVEVLDPAVADVEDEGRAVFGEGERPVEPVGDAGDEPRDGQCAVSNSCSKMNLVTPVADSSPPSIPLSRSVSFVPSRVQVNVDTDPSQQSRMTRVSAVDV